MSLKSSAITWRIHCQASPLKLYTLISTGKGRKQFWAESAEEKNGLIYFFFPNGQCYVSEILEQQPHSTFSLIYFDSPLTFHLLAEASGGTEVRIQHEGIAEEEYLEVYAGWVSVLMSLKAFADFGVDLRNHRAGKTWSEGYVDN